MIRALSSILIVVIALAVPSYEQSTPQSPCPNVFSYEPSSNEPGRWYGVINLSTDVKLYSFWLNVVLDSKAELLGNWIGDVTTKDNIDFRITTNMQIEPGPLEPVRIFVRYNSLSKFPKIQAIRLNGKEVCNDVNLLPAVDLPVPTSKPNIPQTVTNPVVIPGLQWPRPVVKPGTVPKEGQGVMNEGPVYIPTPNPPINEIKVQPFSSTDSDDSIPLPYTGIKEVNENSNYDNKKQSKCGRVKIVNASPLVIDGNPTRVGQWPWQVALYIATVLQTIDLQYHCGGTLVSNRHVITAAHCVTYKDSTELINKATLSVFLGKHNLKNTVEGVQIRFVAGIRVHPDYKPLTFSRDLAILNFLEPVSFTNLVQPACLWPDNQVDLRFVIGKYGTVVGWGIDKTGVGTETLMELEIPVVDQETCIRSHSQFFSMYTSEYTYCAGLKGENRSVCNGDSGGGMVFNLGNTWYLRGLVSLSVSKKNDNRCDPSHYVVFTDLAKFLPWINQNML